MKIKKILSYKDPHSGPHNFYARIQGYSFVMLDPVLIIFTIEYDQKGRQYSSFIIHRKLFRLSRDFIIQKRYLLREKKSYMNKKKKMFYDKK